MRANLASGGKTNWSGSQKLSDVVKSARGLGFMIGLELVEKKKSGVCFQRQIGGDPICQSGCMRRACDDSGRNASHPLLPPLNLKPQEAGEGISKIEEVIKSLV
jgi:adenosylmethionine-8-amino-7-oxononanoate aminotransferase